jgi:hypothetical protein
MLHNVDLGNTKFCSAVTEFLMADNVVKAINLNYNTLVYSNNDCVNLIDAVGGSKLVLLSDDENILRHTVTVASKMEKLDKLI